MEIGDIITGNGGKYKLLKDLGSGGNSKVFQALVIESCKNQVPVQSLFAIKCFSVDTDRISEKEINKRKERFLKEIRTVQELQDEIDGIIPIYDSCNYAETVQWYLMPVAKKYVYQKNSLQTILNDAVKLAVTLQQVHQSDFCHRDIKPSNLLRYNGRICLADFGLALKKGEDPRLTEIGDIIGPVGFRPPELQSITDLEYDMCKSDVYMLAKTIWAMIKKSKHAFGGDYKRDQPDIYLDPDEFNVFTFEPLHRMLEGATKYNYEQRISLEEVILLLKMQRSVLSGDLDRSICTALRAQEIMTFEAVRTRQDRTVYSENTKILRILHAACKFSTIAECDPLDDYKLGMLNNVSMNEQELIILTVEIVDRVEKEYALRVKEIEMTADQSEIKIYTVPLGEIEAWPVYKRLKDAQFVDEERVYIDGEHTFKVQLPPLENLLK